MEAEQFVPLPSPLLSAQTDGGAATAATMQPSVWVATPPPGSPAVFTPYTSMAAFPATTANAQVVLPLESRDGVATKPTVYQHQQHTPRARASVELMPPPTATAHTAHHHRRVIDLKIKPESHCPYAGCKFQLQHTRHGDAASASSGAGGKGIAALLKDRWEWLTPIYHPVLAQGVPLCSCMLRRGVAANTANPTAGMLAVLARMLEDPLRSPYCPACPIRRDVLAEALLDYQFFSRKVRLYTEGAAPLTDSDIRRGAHEGVTANLLGLLESGAYSDIAIVVDAHNQSESQQVRFKCHKTVLAANSKSFAALFESAKAQSTGELRLQRTTPATLARYLYFCYSGDLPRKTVLQPEEYLMLAAVAHACKTESLRQFCVAMLQTTVTTNNVCELLLASQYYKEPSISALLLRFVGVHLRAVARGTSWERLLAGVTGKVGVIVKKLNVIASKRKSAGTSSLSKSQGKSAAMSKVRSNVESTTTTLTHARKVAPLSTLNKRGRHSPLSEKMETIHERVVTPSPTCAMASILAAGSGGGSDSLSLSAHLSTSTSTFSSLVAP